MSLRYSLEEGCEVLIRQLSDRARKPRMLVALAGAPGSGKSTLANALVVQLNQLRPDCAAVLPMDGYHYDDTILQAMGRLTTKGAPDTFDVGGLRHTIRRLRANTEESVAVPVFDRELELSRAAARLIPRSTSIVVVEGNYLLSDSDPWSVLADSFDYTVMLDVPEEVLLERLTARWLGHGFRPLEARARAERNDLLNGRFVIQTSIKPDMVLEVAVNAEPR